MLLRSLILLAEAGTSMTTVDPPLEVLDVVSVGAVGGVGGVGVDVIGAEKSILILA